MLPVDDPQDVYSAVAAAVQKRVQEDASLTGLSEAVKLLERNHGVIDRKLVGRNMPGVASFPYTSSLGSPGSAKSSSAHR